MEASRATTTPVALLCLVAFVVELASQLIRPGPTHVSTKYTGRLTFLTVQTNCIGCLYFLGALVSSCGAKPMRLNFWLRRLFPLMFSLGIFLTVAYYALVHFTPQAKARRQYEIDNGVHYAHLLHHLEHALALPVLIIYARNFLFIPSRVDVPFYVGGFASFYLCFTVVINQLTGDWVYPIFDVVQNKGGNIVLMVFFCCLIGVFVGLGYLGCWVVEATSSSRKRNDSKEM